MFCDKDDIEMLRNLPFDNSGFQREGLNDEVQPPPWLAFDHRLLLANAITENPQKSMFVLGAARNQPELLEFYLFEKRFVKQIKEFLTFIKSLPSEFLYNMLRDKVSSELTSLFDIHEHLLCQFNQILQNANQNCMNDFFKVILIEPSLLEIHQKYAFAASDIEQLIASISINIDRIDGVPLLKMTRLTAYWTTELQRLQRITGYTDPGYTKFIHDCDCLSESLNSVSRLEEISRQFLIEPFLIVVPGRRFVLHTKADKVCRKGLSHREVFLFSDCLLYVQVKAGMYMRPASYSLQKLRFQEHDALSISIFTPSKSFVLQFSSENDKNQLVQALAKHIENNSESFQAAPTWIPDDVTTVCSECSKEFTVLIRRHHCRLCGKIVCGQCSSNRIFVKNISSKKRVRVCDSCFRNSHTD